VVAPWKLPLIVVAIVVPIVFAFYLGGPGVGMAGGALVAVAIVAVAVRQRPRGAIGPARPADGRHRLLIVLGRPLEDRAAIEAVAVAARGDGEEPAETLLLSPARIGFLDRWTSDLEAARREAQQRLVLSVASLAKAGVAAEGRVGDEDLVQAVEDQLGTFPADEVILIEGGEEDPVAEAAATELRARLRPRFRRLQVRS
jgi:hypothetical protein